MHRDICPANLLVDFSSVTLRVADFGLARGVPDDPEREMCPRVCQLPYRAPELLLGSPLYASAIDVWALGCVVAELLAAARPPMAALPQGALKRACPLCNGSGEGGRQLRVVIGR
eukprot:gene14898-58927_t